MTREAAGCRVVATTTEVSEVSVFESVGVVIAGLLTGVCLGQIVLMIYDRRGALKGCDSGVGPMKCLCGHTPWVRKIAWGVWRVKCPMCSDWVRTKGSESDAIAAWNKAGVPE